jgi:uncharacterized membrane protein
MIDLAIVIFTSFSEIKPIIDNRCAMCHNENWPDKNWKDEKLVLKNKDMMVLRLENQSMPPGNATNMTKEERNTLIAWLKKQ